MLKNFYHKNALLFLLSLTVIFSCDQEQETKRKTLKIRVNADANSLNPLKARGETSNYICMQIFQTLISYDYKTNKAVGVLAKDLPQEEKLDSSTTLFTYKLREGISFDSVHPVTPNDILFSFKLAICPGITTKGGSAFYDFIDSLYFPNKNELKVLTHGNYFLNKYFTGDFFILPQHIYDPSGVLNSYSISDLRKDSILEKNQDLQAYSEFFNDIKFEKDINFIKGSGSYEIEEWQSNQRIILKKKPNWWAANLTNESKLFDQKIERIQYEIISDDNTALAAFKSNKVDLIKSIKPKDFKDLKADGNYPTTQKIKSGYQFLAFNLNNPLLSNRDIRKALAYLINKQELIDKVHYGNANKTNSPISSYQTDFYNQNLIKYEFSLDSATNILNRLGWTDSDNDGILDKQIGTEKQELRFQYLYNSNDDTRKSFGIILQNRAKSVGIDIQLSPSDWTNYLKRTKSGEFDLYYGSRGIAPIPPDLYYSFHSKSAIRGRNRSNYQSPIADSLMEGIRATDSEELRIKYYLKLQEQINYDIPMVFLLEPMETFVYSKELKPILTSAVRPNYWAPSLEFKD